MGAKRIMFILVVIHLLSGLCKSKLRKLLQKIPDDYCESYCQGVCNETISEKRCNDDDFNFILTNNYQLILNDGFLEVKWNLPDPKIRFLTAISKERNVKLIDLVVSDTNHGWRAVDYLRQLGIETVGRFEKQFYTFKIVERSVHAIHGPKSLIISVQSSVELNEIFTYIRGTTNNLTEIIIDKIDDSENQVLIMNENIFDGKNNVTSLTFTGFEIQNVNNKTFAALVNLRKLIFSKCTIRNWTFLSTLQKSLQHLELDIGDTVDIKYFSNFPKLKLVNVRYSIPFGNMSALACQQKMCNFVYGINGVKCPDVCTCRFIYDDLELSINCSNRGLSHIPPLPISIIGSVKLIFNNNNLLQLPNYTLAGYNALTKLDVSRNMLTSLSINNLPSKLDFLDISFNKIVKMDRELIEYIKNVFILKQRGNQWIVYCDDDPLLQLFKHLKSIIRLRKVELRPIFRKLLPNSPEGFVKFLGQHFLRLGVRKQKYFLINEDQLVTSMLQKLNDFEKIMSIYKSMEWLHQQLKFINDEYELFYYHQMAAACPYKCECCHKRTTQNLKIDCKNKFIHNFPDIIAPNRSQAQEISNNIELDLSTNNISEITIEMLSENISYLDLRNNSLKTLDDKVVLYLKEIKDYAKIELSGNPWSCDCKSKSILSFLRDFEPLEYNVILSRCQIPRSDCPDGCICCMDNSTWSSFIVDCRGEGLSQIPKLSTAVTYVDLRNNNISELTPKLRSLFQNGSTLSLLLLDNPWSCSCNDMENLNFMKSVSSHIIDFTEIICASGEKLVSIDPDIVCPSGIAYYLALAISLAVLILVINFMICFRQPLLVWFYEHDVCLSLAARRELDQAKKFDAFLAFTHKDEPLVEEFVEKLELGRPRFSLCFYLRDWLAGESIPDCIGRSVRDSRRIIILMTDNFMKSTWGRLEFRLALHATSQDRCKRLIVVLYPDVKDFDSLDSELRAYMVFNTYLERSHPNFWNKLIYSMPHAKLRRD